jgi:hypothetical protein
MRSRQRQPDAGSIDHEFDYVDLGPIARSMGVTIADLSRLSATGRFAPVIRLTERRAIARKIDLKAWEARAQIQPQSRDSLRTTFDVTPAEPFSHLQAHTRTSRAPRRTAAGNGATRAGVEAARVANTTESPSSELEVRDEV